MRENKAFFISIGLHLLILASLVFGISFNDTKMVFALPNAQPINAVFIDAQKIADRKRQQQAEAQARQREIERQEKARLERIAREKKAQEEAARRKREEARKKQQEEERKRKEQEQKNLEQAAREEAEFQRRLKEEKERQEKLEKELAEQLAQEQEAMRAAQQQMVMTELQKYQALITQTILQNLIIDESAKNKECIIRVKLAPDGLVIDTTIVEGDAALCQAARTAVLRPATLPVSKDPLVYEQMKDIKLTVSPKNIR